MKLLDQVNLERLACELRDASKRYKIDARLESYSCKMVTEEKRQFKELVNRLGSSSDKVNEAGDQRLGASQTIRGIRELTGQSISTTYQMSCLQNKSPPPNSCSSPNARHTGNSNSLFPCGRSRKRLYSATASTSVDSSLSPSPSSLPVKDLFCLMSTLNSCFGPAYEFLTARSDEFCLEPELWLVKHYICQFCSIYMDKYEEMSCKLWRCIDEEVYLKQCVIYSYRPDHLSDPYSLNCLASFNYFFYNRTLRRVLFFSIRILNEPSSVDEFEYTETGTLSTF